MVFQVVVEGEGVHQFVVLQVVVEEGEGEGVHYFVVFQVVTGVEQNYWQAVLE